MVPADYFQLADKAGGVELLPAWFKQHWTDPQRGDEEWNFYLSGQYVCLGEVTPAAIVRKDDLSDGIKNALATSRPQSPEWLGALHALVDELDGITMEFTDYDRLRFNGPVSRDTLINDVRAQYPMPALSTRRATAMRPVTLAAAGDVLINRPYPGEVFSSAGPLLGAADIAFGNFEGVLTDTHVAMPGASIAAIAGTANAAPLSAFSVLSLANNHAMDAGYGGLSDTVETLAKANVAAVGAGQGLTAALAPHVAEREGLRVAILAVTAVFAMGTQAREGFPGIAPLRAEDCWAPSSPGIYTPGVPPRILSILDERDWEHLEHAIASARERADIVVVSAHWGDHTRPWVLTEHERLCAELLAGAGVDLVLGHHQHMLRGVEFVDGTPVFYGLGHLAFDMPRYGDELRSRGIDVDAMTARERAEQLGEFGIYPRPETPAFPFASMARNSAIAIVEMGSEGIARCGMAPFAIDSAGIPRAVSRGDQAWAGAVSFLRTCAERAHLSSAAADTGWTHAGYDIIEWVDGP
ncbi:MAG TPA: DUF6058 family natural product biosynthesis protein [Trebonia sp.]|nr:DUF6058 family natural product biosynthesis protein [Trebonia sp.]